MPPVPKRWRLLPQQTSATERLAQLLGLSPVVAQLLLNRGVTDAEQARRFLSMPFGGLHDPELLPGVPEAATLLLRAIRERARICIYGDYDVDGLSGTAILWQALRLLGATPDFYVPHRLDEGYGLNREALLQIARTGATVVVTVDCGIGSLEEADEARKLGMQLIVTDHHEFKDRLPEALLIHPRLPGSRYPFGDLSGSGVAFKLAWALCRQASGSTRVTPELREFLLDSVGLAALGMVADCVPLRDENRIIVRHGLARLARTNSIGLRALCQAAGLGHKDTLASTDISFTLAPRLNAAGRLGCARLVVELLTTASQARAADLARYLDAQNSQRQQIERRILEEARTLLDGDGADKHPALVLASSEWHPGVIGIVAGRLAEQYARPVFLIALRAEQGIGQGSARSVDGFPLHVALQQCGDCLLSHGGHARAAGFKIAPDHVERFRERIHACAAQQLTEAPAAPQLVIDAEVPLSAVTPGLIESLNHLEPYGTGNPTPRFLVGPVQVDGSPRVVGRDERHLQVRFRQHQTCLPAIAFNHAHRLEELLSQGGQCCVVFTPTFNTWQGYRRVQLEVVDFQPGCRAQLA